MPRRTKKALSRSDELPEFSWTNSSCFFFKDNLLAHGLDDASVIEREFDFTFLRKCPGHLSEVDFIADLQRNESPRLIHHQRFARDDSFHINAGDVDEVADVDRADFQ